MGRVNPLPVKGSARDGQAVGYLQIEGGADVDICRPQWLRMKDAMKMSFLRKQESIVVSLNAGQMDSRLRGNDEKRGNDE
jgi:hypothetical protein